MFHFLERAELGFSRQVPSPGFVDAPGQILPPPAPPPRHWWGITPALLDVQSFRQARKALWPLRFPAGVAGPRMWGALLCCLRVGEGRKHGAALGASIGHRRRQLDSREMTAPCHTHVALEGSGKKGAGGSGMGLLCPASPPPAWLLGATMAGHHPQVSPHEGAKLLLKGETSWPGGLGGWGDDGASTPACPPCQRPRRAEKMEPGAQGNSPHTLA